MKSGIKNIYVLVLVVILPFCFRSVNAQNNIAFYPLEEQFNASDFNPAFLNPENRFTFSIFPLGGTSLSYNNQKAIRDLVSKFISGSTTDQDYRDIFKSLAARPTFDQNFETTFLSFAYKSKLGNFDFRIKEHENFTISSKGSLSNFIFKNGIQHTEVGIFQDLPAQAIHYREYSIGYSLPSKNHRFTAGIRAKLYFGKGAFSSGLSGAIQNDGSDYSLQAEGKVLISVPEINTLNADSSLNSVSLFKGSKTITYLMNRGNPGFGIDFGFKYNIAPNLSFSGSVTDLGKINWRTNLNSKSFLGEYQIDGSTVTSQTMANGTEIITKKYGEGAIIDSISNPFTISYDHSKFSLNMPVSVYTAIKYQFDSGINLNFTNRHVIIKNMSYNSMALTTDFDINKNLSVNTGYAIIENTYFNIPVAFLFKREFGQIYVGSDNLAAFFIPSISDFAGFSFGMCFYLFRKHKSEANYSKYFPFYKERKIRSNSKGLLIRDDKL